MSRPTLSVVMPNYNHARFLPRSIGRIAEQTRPPDELLILDDASTDNSVDVIAEHCQRFAFIKLIRNKENQGVNAANNRLFALTSGDYLHAAAADDYLLPEFFERAMELAEQHPQAGLCFGRMQIRNEQDALLSVVEAKNWREPLYADPEKYLREFLESELATSAAAVSTIFRRDAFEEAGGYRTELGPWADTFAARAVGLKHGVCYAPEDFAAHIKVSGGFSDQGNQTPRRQLDIADRAARLMRTPQFRDRFPEAYVRRWRNEFRRLTIWNYWLGVDYSAAAERPSFMVRNLRRLPRVIPALALAFYRGDTSCYDSPAATDG